MVTPTVKRQAADNNELAVSNDAENPVSAYGTKSDCLTGLPSSGEFKRLILPAFEYLSSHRRTELALRLVALLVDFDRSLIGEAWTTGKARGGYARAASLPPERRREIAKKAAKARWSGA